MLKWPERAKSALRKLFEPLQDIDVYVEDINDEAFYRCLLSQATKGKVKVARVFSLGGRKPVIDAAMAYDQNTRPALFIIDGDFPWVKGELEPTVIGLHCHDAYCIENHLLCEKALSLVLSQEIVISEEEASERLQFDIWRQSISGPLLDLFSAFATVHDLDPTVPTVSQGVGNMCIKRRSTSITELDISKVNRARESALKAAENASTPAATAKLYKRFLNRLESLPDPLLAISGKDFLLPLLDFHLQSLGCRIKRRSLRVRLASAGDISRFSKLADSLIHAASRFR